MLQRDMEKQLKQRLGHSPVVALLGSRQVGKTTLARGLALDKPWHYLDMERPSDMAKLADPELYLEKFSQQLVIVDEVQRMTDLFPVLRSLVDERRLAGEKAGHFLLLGSASPDLLRQGSETLAGRISYLELTPFQLQELHEAPVPYAQVEKHWCRGGYPESFLADDEAISYQWREDFLTSYVERDLPQQGITASPRELRRLCSMLAHHQGGLLNMSQLGNALGIDGKTVRHYIGLLEGLFLLRTLPAWSKNAGKRLVKAPKVYWRDSGLLHQLAGLHDLEQVLGHSLCGMSWEGYCIEQIAGVIPQGYTLSHYRTHAGAEVDLVIESPSGQISALEIKRTRSPKLTAGMRESMKSLGAQRGYYIMPYGDAFPMADDIQAIGLREFLHSQSDSGNS